MNDKFTADELRRIIGDAANRVEAAPEYTADEVLAAATGVGLPEAAVRTTMMAVVQGRRQREREATQRWEQLQRRLQRAGWITACVALLIGLLVMFTTTDLNVLAERVKAQHAQVRTVMGRRAATEAQWATQPVSAERNAEIAGATNRVAIELRRYDVVVRSYNKLSGSWRGALACRIEGLPGRMPYSNEVQSW